jgi:hypothetical protein
MELFRALFGYIYIREFMIREDKAGTEPRDLRHASDAESVQR